jgi:hypothetical protein
MTPSDYHWRIAWTDHQRPGGRGGIAGWVGREDKARLLSVGLNFRPFSCCIDNVSPRITGVSATFRLMAALPAQRTHNQCRLSPLGSKLDF